jgi:hypothetical protein
MSAATNAESPARAGDVLARDALGLVGGKGTAAAEA